MIVITAILEEKYRDYANPFDEMTGEIVQNNVALKKIIKITEK